MDQNSTNGPGPDKRNWRERLGIGAKEMPKLSDEFRDEAARSQSAGEAARPAPRGAQPVMSPAPMAPRTPKAVSPSGAAPSAPPPPRATPRMPDNAAQEALAEKLRAQRAAAEKLAEQRVQAARDRAEGKTPPQPEPATTRAAPAAPRPPAGGAGVKPRAPIPPAPGGRPKFSFAEEPAAARDPRTGGDAPAVRPGLSGAPLTPPRPALGGDRGQPPFLRPSTQGLGARPQPPYKPVEPNSAAGYGPPPRLQPPPTARGGYGAEPAAPSYPGARSAPRRPPALESYPRQEIRDFAEGEQDERQVPRLGRPAPRGRAPKDDLDEVFEDDGSTRQRASARDYQSAYSEADAFADDTRRSSGPWLLLLAILAAAMIAGGGWWYYNTNMKNVAGPGATTGEVPVVNAPVEPAKVAPETPSATSEEPAAKKKQIYDRIVGEQEVIGGQLQQTEELPVPPATTQPVSDVPAATGANPIPAPDAAVQGTDSQGLPTVDEPPPLPLPPAGGEQGSLDNKSVERIAAASAQPEQGATAPPEVLLPDPVSTSSTSSASLLPPPPEKATDGAALVSDTASAAAPPPGPEDGAMEEPAPPPPPKKKPVAKKKTQQETASKDLGAEPVVLVPPSKTVPAEMETASNTPITDAPAEAPPVAPAPAKKKTIMDLFRGGSDDAGEQAAAAPAETQVASIEQQPPPATAKKQAGAPPATGSGFVIQLASFRTESDARKEYSRLSAAYPSVIGGLQQQIKPTSVGGSTRYQLGLGPLPSRSEATKVCSALITAGESDCIVRGR